MTPDEILRELRDIHQPPGPVSGSGSDFAPEPFLILAILLAVLVLAHAWRRGRAKRALRRRLVALSARGATAESWQGLLALLSAAARRGPAREPVPEAAFRRPDTVSSADHAALRRHLARRLGPTRRSERR